MTHNWNKYLQEISKGELRSLARSISLIENEVEGYDELLLNIRHTDTVKITGITGPPGAGKSTLVDALIGEMVKSGKKVAVLCIDPSSPFNLGALLGDRIRMSEWYTNPNVYIRSLATRGSLGGLHPRIIEITEILKAAPFDHIIVETVGVGQSEIEIAGLADTTVVVLVPEAGDDIQTMKAGLMEIADIFVVNKSDRPGADKFVQNLKMMMTPSFNKDHNETAILKTVASEKNGISELVNEIQSHLQKTSTNDKRAWLLAERAYHIIQSNRMRDIDKRKLVEAISEQLQQEDFNLYKFIQSIA